MEEYVRRQRGRQKKGSTETDERSDGGVDQDKKNGRKGRGEKKNDGDSEDGE